MPEIPDIEHCTNIEIIQAEIDNLYAILKTGDYAPASFSAIQNRIGALVTRRDKLYADLETVADAKLYVRFGGAL